MIFKNNKCVEISKKEYRELDNIITNSTCFKNAVDNVVPYLKNYKIFKFVDNLTIQDCAFYLTQAIVNKYKYMKIVD